MHRDRALHQPAATAAAATATADEPDAASPPPRAPTPAPAPRGRSRGARAGRSCARGSARGSRSAARGAASTSRGGLLAAHDRMRVSDRDRRQLDGVPVHVDRLRRADLDRADVRLDVDRRRACALRPRAGRRGRPRPSPRNGSRASALRSACRFPTSLPSSRPGSRSRPQPRSLVATSTTSSTPSAPIPRSTSQRRRTRSGVSAAGVGALDDEVAVTERVPLRESHRPPPSRDESRRR